MTYETDQPMMGAGSLPGELDPACLFSLLIASLRNASAVILDEEGVVVWRSGQAGQILCQSGLVDMIGRRLDAVAGKEWGRERYELIAEAHAASETRSLFSIWMGRRMVSRFTPIEASGRAWTLAISESASVDQMKDELANNPGARAARCAVFGPLDALTGRELQVLALLGEGMRPKEIATTLSRSVSTVEGHRERIGQKLGLHDRAELLLVAQRAALRLEDADAERARIIVGRTKTG